MNSISQKLIAEVGADVSGKWIAVGKIDQIVESVVKECLDFVEASATGEPDNSEAQAALLACALNILEHFDMELDDDFT